MALRLDRPRRRWPARSACRNRNQAMLSTVRVETEPQEPPAQLACLWLAPQHDRTGPIAEQESRIAIGGIDGTRLHFRGHYQTRLDLPAPNHRIGHRESIEKARTGSRHVECRYRGTTEHSLNMAGGGGEDRIGRGCRKHNRPQLRNRESGSLKRRPSCFHRKIRRRLGRSSSASLLNSCQARDNRRLDAQRSPLPRDSTPPVQGGTSPSQ